VAVFGVAAWLMIAAAGPAAAEPAPVHLATLEWSPYTSRDLPAQGPVTEIIRQAFRKAGRTIKVHVLPWKRAIARAKSWESPVAAYFPGYHCRHDTGFTASAPIGNGPLNLAERADEGITWRTLEDLTKLRIGTVVGYANTPEFDAWVASGRLKVITAADDTTNLLKLAKRQVDVAVVDGLVFRYLMANEPRLAKVRSRLRLDDMILAHKTLYLCFRDTPDGHRLVGAFNKGLGAIDKRRIMEETFKRLLVP